MSKQDAHQMSAISKVRKYVVGAFFGLLIGMLLIGLSMFGVTDAFMSRSKNAAAQVGKSQIKLQDFSDFFQKRLSDYNKQAAKAGAERLTTKQAYARGLQSQAINQLITEKLVQLEADKLGVDVNEKDVLKTVEDLKIFNNEITGKFDKNKMLSQLYRIDNNLTPKKLEANIKSQIRHQQVVDSILGGVVAPEYLVDQQYRFMTEQRKAKLLQLTAKAVSPPEDPGDETLKAYIKDHQASYIAPEYRRFTLIRVELDDIFVDQEVSEKEVKELFDYKIEAGKLGKDETRSYQQIIAKDKAQAEAITKALNAGTPIKDVVAKFNLDAPLVYTDASEKAATDPKTGKAAYALKKPGEAQTIASSFGGWYSVLLTGITEKYVPDIEKERASLEQEIRLDKTKQFLYEVSDKVQKSLEQGMTLEEAARANGVSVASYDFINRLGETLAGKKLTGLDYAPGIATDDKILKEIFTADLGFDGDVFETSNEGIAAVRVDDIKASAARPFPEIRRQALSAWRAQKIDEDLAKLSGKILTRAKAGESFQTLAAEINAQHSGAAIVHETPMLRAIATPGISKQLAINLFEAKQGQIVRGRASNGTDRIIARVVEITPNSDAIIGGLKSEMNTSVLNQIQSDIQEAWQKGALKEHPAQIKSENIKRVLGIDEQQ